MSRSRREFLRDVGLSAAALPFVLNLPSLGFANQRARKQRLVVMFSPDGVVPWNFWPEEEGSEFTLKDSLTPLEGLKSRMLTLHGVCDRIRGDGDNHMRGIGCLLTGIELFPGNIQGGSHTPAGWASGISVDQEIKNFLQANPETRTLYDPGRMRRVLTAAAERGGYGARAPEGRARGLAAHFTFGSYCAQVVELSVDGRKRVVVHKVTAVADVGQPINLSALEAQAEGGIIDGLGAAFFGEVPIERGRATVSNFDDYRLIRNREAPASIDVMFVPSRVRPTGFGEIAVPPIAPAIANGIAAATGERLRRMPFTRLGYDLGVARG